MIILVFSFLLTLLGFFSQFGFWFDMFSHFRLQYFLIQCIAWVVFGIKKQFRWMGFATIFIILNGLCILPYYWPQNNFGAQSLKHDRPDVGTVPLNITMLNVHSENTQKNEVIKYLMNKHSDIIALEEINEQWISWLRPVLLYYPYFKEIPRKDNFGIGLYSRIPLKDIHVEYFSGAGVPSLIANLTYQDKEMTIVFTHPVPPATQTYFHWRNEQLAAIAKARDQWHQNLIILGDLNVTSWSQYFKNFLSQTRLKDSRLGYGLQTTWPSFLSGFGIAIDHVLLSDCFFVQEREIGSMVGSDHFPVYISLGVLEFFKR